MRAAFTMSSFRVIHKIPDQRLNPCSYLPLEDRFHPTFPSYLSTCGRLGILREPDQSQEQASRKELISRLPVELSDLIFSNLTPTSLDAARYTCREWWCRIITRSWVVSTILGPDRAAIAVPSSSIPAPVSISDRPQAEALFTKAGPPENARLGRLVKRFHSAVNHSSTWRIQYRKRTPVFSLPKSRSYSGPTLRYRIVGTAFYAKNPFIAFLVQRSLQFEEAAEPRDRTRKVLLYKLCQLGPPILCWLYALFL